MGRKYVIEIDEEHPFVRKTIYVNEKDKAYDVKGTSLIINEEELKGLTALDDFIIEHFDILGIMSYEKGWDDCNTLWRNYFDIDTCEGRIEELKEARLKEHRKEKNA